VQIPKVFFADVLLSRVARLRCAFTAGDGEDLEAKGDLVESLKDEEKALSLERRRVLNEAGRIRQEKTSGQSKDCLHISWVLYTIGTGCYISNSGLINLTISRHDVLVMSPIAQ
jgi:hypothetical protein